METITYLNLSVDGTPIEKIVSLSIKHSINQHAIAELTGEAPLAAAGDFAKRCDETTKVTITTKASGQPAVIFCGLVANVGVEKQDAYGLLKLSLKSTSYLLDTKKKNKSFQNTGKTYEEILKETYGSSASLTMNVSDKAIGSIVMQYSETDWEFTRRIAANFNAPVFANVDTPKPNITIGMPTAGKSYTLKDVETDYGSSLGGGTGLKSHQYMYLGDKVSYGGQTERVKELSATMVSGILTTTVAVASDKGFEAQNALMSAGQGTALGTGAAGGGGNGVGVTTNAAVSGKMFTGIVQAVQKDKVQVHLVDIDAEYDGGGNYWFPYSTAYSSSDGSGFYCMPAEGDTVRVFFPSGKEGEAFAASSVNVSPLDDPTHKKWRSPAGKEILMTEEGIFITCKENKIFINLANEDGITISCDKDINICSKTNISVMANEKMVLQADNNILISTAESYIDMKPEKIEVGAYNVTIA
ncbi:MAG: hypothetical protein HDR22_08635 [Lachnospiraceae bacterium]|nr:hypothetical protein [Lachnospiraceae bacterium]